jgi:diguanylate cyclase (GGDEF)-like protein
VTALLIALAAALVGVLVVALVGQRLLAQGKSGRGAGADELQRAQVELRRAKQLLQLSALTETLDLDDLLGRVLQGATQLASADAAAVALWSKGEAPIVKALSLPADEALPLLGSWPPESRSRAITVRYRFPNENVVAANTIQLGVLLPLSGEPGSPDGTLGIFWRRTAEEPSEEDMSALEELAIAAGKAIDSARQFQELHERAIRDPLTGLHNRRYFHETLAHEVKRAHRYDRRLALIFFDLDDFKGINDEVGHLGGDSVLAEVAQRLRLVVRGADIPCRVGGDEFAVILPESSLEDTERFFRRLQLAIQGQPIGRVPNLQISGGMAELGRDDDATSLFRRADQALYRAKRAGKGRVMAAEDPDESSEAP